MSVAMPPPNLPRLHWAPVEPSWIVSVGLIVLAVLPHQIPKIGREAINHPIGRLLFAAASAAVAYMKPVLGAAMFIFMAGIILHESSGTPTFNETFAATNLNKDIVNMKEKRRWFDEEVLSENPKAIQEKTENPVMSYDEIVDHDAEPWQSEHAAPHAIQEKAVAVVPEYDEGGSSYGHR
jgi:hypothetical protein